MLVLSITENMGFGFVASAVGVDRGVESGVGVEYGVDSGVSSRKGVDSNVTVGRGVGSPSPLPRSPLPRVTMKAIKTPKIPMTKTIARIQGKGL